jgi:hypothetical protein
MNMVLTKSGLYYVLTVIVYWGLQKIQLKFCSQPSLIWRCTMTRLTKSDTSLEVRPIAPALVARPELAACRPGYVKVRLSYQTSQPQHLRSLLLLHTCGIQPPYTEETCILLPAAKVFTLLETFIPSFEYLQKCGVLSKTAELLDFKVLDEDDLTLAYIF